MATLPHVHLSFTSYFSHNHHRSAMNPASFFLLSSSSLWLHLLHSIPVAAAQPNTSGSPYPDTRVTPSMAIIIIILIFALFFMGFFSIYFRRCSDGSIRNGGSFRAVLGAVAGRSRRGQRGLDEAMLNTYPTFVYSEVKTLKIGKGALECAVCLNEFEDEDTLRLITKCDHVFHSDCIDAWLDSHVTCPVCRANLQQGEEEEEQEQEQESPPPHVVQIGIDSGDAGGGGEVHPPEAVEQEPDSSVRQPRHHSRAVRSWSTPRFFGRYPRSHSTGHSLAQNQERYTLRLPENVRKELMGRSLKRGGSMVLARERSSRRGYRGDGSGRGGSSRYRRLEHRRAKSDRWVFTVAPPFFSRWPSLKLHKGTPGGGGGEHSGTAAAHKSWSTPLSGGGKVEGNLDRGPRTSSGRVLV